MTAEHLVVVGAGQAGGELVAALRAGGFEGGLTLVGREGVPPYGRPPLSKAYLLGDADPAGLALRAVEMYERERIALRLGRTVTALDRDRRRVLLDDGTALDYTTLVLATGGRSRRLPIPALDGAPNVLTLRTLADVDRLRPRFVEGARLAVVGGGYIGLEVASVARRRGLDVTVLEAADRVLARTASAPISCFLQRVHEEEGVRVRLGAQLTGARTAADGTVRALLLQDGSTVPVDIVLVGIGLVPETELAARAGLHVDDGIVVDEQLRTSDPAVYAIGDVARHPDPERGGLRRLESVPNASEQARVLAQTLLGRPAPYRAVPWFWSDQYDLKLQVCGLLAPGDDLVVRGDPRCGRRIAVFALRDGAVRAAEVAGSAADFAVAKRLVAGRTVLPAELLADLGRSLRELAAVATADPSPHRPPFRQPIPEGARQ